MNETTSKLHLPVLALRQLVISPGTSVPIAAGRPKTLRAIEASLENHEGQIFAVLQREDTADIEPGNLYTIGTIAKIEQIQRGLAGTQLLVTGQQRGIALRVAEENGHFVATLTQAEELLPQDHGDLAFTALYREVRNRAEELADKSGLPREVAEKVLASVEHPGRLADLVAGYLDIAPEQRQELLETFSVEERLRKVVMHVQRQIGVLDAQASIKNQVQEELGDRQREIYLREQMKAIQKELGDDDEIDEMQDLRERIEALDLKEDVSKEVHRELRRLERMGREAMEAQVIRTFLENVIELPWSERSEDLLKATEATRVLDEDHYGLGEVKDRILEFLAVRQMQQRHESADTQAELSPPNESSEARATAAAAATTDTQVSDDVDGDANTEAEVSAEVDQGTAEQDNGDSTKSTTSTRKSPILLFTGPPGVGKTSLAKSIARSMGREYVRISLGGVRDEADIRGHRRTYVGALPGRIIQGMRQAGTKNPVFLLDEVDKLGASFQGDPSSALLEVLDPAQNDSFTDHYLGLPFDLSEVFFIATANFPQNIPGPLMDRMETVEFTGYTEAEKLEIAKQYLVPRQIEEGGLLDHEVRFTDGGIRQLISHHTREAGVRQLERELARIVRKVARRLAESSDQQTISETFAVNAEAIGDLLGRPKVHPEKAATEDQIGVTTGLFYTPMGGDIMFVEASTMPGKGNLQLTGQLGDVMQESARAAWTFARSHTAGLRIKATKFDDVDVHIHCPAGAIPKDGPSAGVTMATALVSVLSDRPARHDIAMTGEITLSGRVLPIGGVKEKILGAVRAGIKEIILPRDNERDLEDLSDEVRAQIKVHLAGDLGEVLAVALRDASYEDGRLLFPDEDPTTVSPLWH